MEIHSARTGRTYLVTDSVTLDTKSSLKLREFSDKDSSSKISVDLTIGFASESCPFSYTDPATLPKVPLALNNVSYRMPPETIGAINAAFSSLKRAEGS